MASKSLSDTSSVVRHLSAKDFDVDDQGEVIIFPHAFELRKEEPYLSAAWLEFFVGSLDDRIAATAAFMSKTRKINSNHAFAIGNVKEIKTACSEHDQTIRILHEPNEHNVAYVAVRRYRSDSEELLDLLAREAWAKFANIKAAIVRFGPWQKA